MESGISKTIQCDKCFNDISDKEFPTHIETCHTINITDSNTNKNEKINITTSSIEKNNKAQTEIGIDSVKSLRERLDKKLKAISETIDSISKKESMRGLSSNRERDRLEFGSTEKKPNYNYNSIDYDNSLPKFNITNNNSVSKENKFENKLENLKSQMFSNEENSNVYSYKQKENIELNGTSNKINFDYNNIAPNINIMKTINTSSSYQNNILNLKDKEIEIIKSRGNSGPKNNKNFSPSKIENKKFKENDENIHRLLKENQGMKSNILIDDNFDVNKINSSPNNNDDLNNINFLNNTDTAGIEINANNYNKNFVIEENFMANDIYYKNLINNEISKISHDNFNDEGDPISDNEVDNFDFKRKKYNNIAVNDTEEQYRNRNKNFININDNQEDDNELNKELNVDNKKIDKIKKTEEQLLDEIEELNSINNPKGKEFLKQYEMKKDENVLNANIGNLIIKKDQNENKININPKNNNNTIIQQITSKEKKINQLKTSNTNNKFNFNSTKDDISMFHNINNSLEKIEQSIRIHDENLLQKIEETNKEKYLEAMKNQEELEKIEANLNLMQRLTHEKWQIRKNAFKQISELIMTLQSNKTENENNETDLQETMETLFPWFKYLITDTNVVALNEGLNSFAYLLEYCNNEQKNKALILFFDELEKLIMHNKNSILDLCVKIIMNSVNTKKFATFTISEMIRKLNTTNNKLLTFIHRVIEEMLENQGTITEHYIRLLFEKVVLYYNTTKQLNKNVERKKVYGKIITTIFEHISDDLETLKHHLNINSEDISNFEKLLGKVNKEKKEKIDNNTLKYTLYEAVPETKNSHNINTFNNNKIKNINDTSVLNAYGFSNKNVLGALNNNLNSKDQSDLKNYGSNLNNNNLITEIVDLFNILPNEFFEIPYITALKVKKEILENVNRKLADYVNIKDREYKEILNIVNYTIDDTNVLVNLEGIKFLKNFCRLTKSNSNQAKLKNLVISCYEKFKDKKTNVKLELFDLFNTILLNGIFQFEQFFVFKLQHVISQKNPIVKQNILEYIKEIFSKSTKTGNKNVNNNANNENSETNANYKSPLKTEESITRSFRGKSRDFKNNLNNQDENIVKGDNINENAISAGKNEDEYEKNIKEILNKYLKSKNIITLSKLLVDIIKDDSQSQVKDLSVEILLILKSILEADGDYSSLEKYENLISALPNFRVNMIISGRTKSQNENQNSEKEYKANLNRIKSNLQLTSRNKSQQKLGRMDTMQSASKEKNLKSALKNNLNKNIKSKANETSVSKFDKLDNPERFEERDENENSGNQKNLTNKNLRKFNSKNLLNKNRGNNTTMKNEDSKYNENSISDDEEENTNTKKYLKTGPNNKSPNIKLISKKSMGENLENFEKFSNKKKIEYEDESISNEKFKKIKQKEIDEKVKKELRDKSQNRINLSKKTKQLNDNIKKIKANDLSKASATDESAYLDNSKNEKLTVNNKKNTTKNKKNINQNKIQQNNKNKNLKEKETDLSNISDAPPTTKRTDKTNLEKKMDSAIEYISNLNQEHIFDYTKSVIRDFLIFIKKVTSSNNDKEDLDCHFKVILKILENIYNQMEKLSFNLDYECLNLFIPEEIFIQTFKIIIVAPCFLLDIDNYLIPFIKKLRKIISNDNKFFEIYFEILNKFICFEKGSSFLQGVNSKNTFIVFYDFFLLDDPPFEDSELLEKFEPHILKNIFFSEDEKMKYVKEFKQAIKILEITQKNKENEKDKNSFKDDFSNIDNEENNFNNKSDENSEKDNNDEDHIEQKVKISINNLNDLDNKNKNFNHKDKSSHKQYEEKKDNSNEDIKENKNNLSNNIEDEEDLIINNYGKVFKNKENKIIISNENEDEDNNNLIGKNNNNTDINKNMKSQSFKNINNYSHINTENIYKTERSQTNEKISENIILPENLDKDILKIKDSIKEKCRKLDMNIKRINNKIENEINPNNKNIINDKSPENQQTTNTTNSNISNSQNDYMIHNKLNDYKNKMQNNNYNSHQQLDNNNQHFKPKRNLEDLDEFEAVNDQMYNNNQDIYNVYNLPKFNNFMQNKINNLPITNRSNDMNNNQMYNSNQNIDLNQKLNYINNVQNRVNYTNVIQNPNASHIRNESINIDEIKKLILKIPTIILDDCVSEISHYVILENSFMKMNSEMKIEFTTFLSSSINNSALIKTSSFNCFLQLLEFLLTLLIFEMKNNQKNNSDLNSKNIILKLQETIENILKHKNFTEIFKVLIFLLRKYLPNDFGVQIERDNLIYLKTISYLLKISLENKIKQQANISTVEILSEINELFIMYSPANLNPNVPNLEDLDKIYKLLRLLTDDAINGSQNLALAKSFLDNAKKSDSTKFCSIFLQYLENIIHNAYNKNLL